MKKWFEISSSEEKGIWALNMIIGAVLLFKLIGYWFQNEELQKENPDVASAFIEFVEEQNRLDSINNAEQVIDELNKPVKEKVEVARLLFPFNPNKIGLDSLILLGFKTYQAKNLIKYRNAGGQFNKAEDLNKLYGVKPDFIASILPFVQLPKEKIEPEKNKEATIRQIVELNRADTTLLKSLKGVGSYFAKKIVERRNALGGFISERQLLEVWNLDSAVLSKNEGLIRVDLGRIQKININTVSKDELKKHPYLTWKQANSIVAYREQHGNYESIVQIKASILISDEVYLKIAPYLTID